MLRSEPHAPSFDTVCEANLVKVKNGVENTAKEIGTRFDFKGTSASIEIKDKEITLIGDAEFQLDQIADVLRNKLTKQEAWMCAFWTVRRFAKNGRRQGQKSGQGAQRH